MGILQKSINDIYGSEHSLIIANNGWKVIFEGSEQNKPGLICKQIGCLITIKMINIINEIDKNNDDLYISFIYAISNQENEMGIAKIWIDTKSEINLNDDQNADAQIFDAFVKNTKAISKHTMWILSTSDFRQSDELYFHALIIDDDNQNRKENKFKILGFEIRSG